MILILIVIEINVYIFKCYYVIIVKVTFILILLLFDLFLVFITVSFRNELFALDFIISTFPRPRVPVLSDICRKTVIIPSLL